MRRGVGVARIQQQMQRQEQMAQLGAQITAESVGQIADQMETLEKQLQTLAARHKDEIKNDPLIRARFRQLADSLGVDLLSSKKNVFAGALGLGDFYYSLASKVVEVCMKERKFCGSYVPLQKVVQELQRLYDTQSAAAADARGDGKAKKRTVISEDDVTVAMKKLDCLGGGYKIVTLAKAKYIQTTPDGASGTDEVPLLNFVIQRQKTQVEKAKEDAKAALAAKKKATNAPSTGASGVSPRGAGFSGSPGGGRFLVGAAYVLGAHPFMSEEEAEVVNAIPLISQCVALRQSELTAGLGWPAHRVHAAMQRMVQAGSVWIEYPDATAGGAPPLLRATEQKSSKKRGSKKNEEDQRGDENAVYWFISLTSSADTKP